MYESFYLSKSKTKLFPRKKIPVLYGIFHFRRGSLLSTAIFVYAATSPVNGYFGGSLYARMGGKHIYGRIVSRCIYVVLRLFERIGLIIPPT